MDSSINNYEGVLDTEAFLNALCDDLNTPNALTEVYRVIKEANIALRSNPLDVKVLEQKFFTIKKMMDLLGLSFDIHVLTDEEKTLLNDYKTHITDLNFLVKEKIPVHFHSHVCHQEYVYFKRKKEELINTLELKEREYVRNKNLFESKVISEEEFDHSLFQYEQQQYQLKIFIENQLSIFLIFF